MALRDRDIQIRRPCPVQLDPDRARGGVKSWYCGHCEKSVYVLSNMTESEAREFLSRRVGQDLCVTYAVRRDGTIRFEPDPTVVPVTALTRGRKVAAAVGLGLALAACAPHDNPDVQANLRIADPPTHAASVPTIPDAPGHGDEMLVDGMVAPDLDEQLVDGDVGPGSLAPGQGIVEPPPPPKDGLTMEPLPPDEPCSKPVADQPRPLVRGRIRATRPIE